MNDLKPFPTGANESDQPAAQRVRPWKVVAEELSHEQDSAKLSALVDEHNQALDEQGVGESPL